MEDILAQELIQNDTLTDTVEELVDLKRLIVHNDEVNTFDWVIQALVEICSHTDIQAEQVALIIHFKGKSVVREGSFELLHPMKAGLTDRGISATIE